MNLLHVSKLRKSFIGLAAWCALACAMLRAAEPVELPIWNGVAPGSEGMTGEEKWQERGRNGVVDRAVREVSRPTIMVHLPDKSRATGVALLIAPGGGYDHVTMDKEGNDIARWFVTQGIAGIVLKYRMPRAPFTMATSVGDAVEALKVVRAHAVEWGIDPAKVGMLGFSAGAHLTAFVGTRPPKEARPAFLALLYPFQMATPDFESVPADTPISFIAQANDDGFGTENALRFYTISRAQKISAELHLFAKGGHGFGLGRPGTPAAEWPRLLCAWLTQNGILAGPAAEKAGR